MFGDSVAAWQKRLGTVDAVLTTWTDVQKKWQALESIFVGSPDIRVQLPEDSKRCAAVNADYQVAAGGAAAWVDKLQAATAAATQLFSGHGNSHQQLAGCHAHPTATNTCQPQCRT